MEILLILGISVLFIGLFFLGLSLKTIFGKKKSDTSSCDSDPGFSCGCGGAKGSCHTGL